MKLLHFFNSLCIHFDKMSQIHNYTQQTVYRVMVQMLRRQEGKRHHNNQVLILHWLHWILFQMPIYSGNKKEHILTRTLLKKFTVEADLLTPILQWTKTLDWLFLQLKRNAKFIWTDIFHTIKLSIAHTDYFKCKGFCWGLNSLFKPNVCKFSYKTLPCSICLKSNLI